MLDQLASVVAQHAWHAEAVHHRRTALAEDILGERLQYTGNIVDMNTVFRCRNLFGCQTEILAILLPEAAIRHQVVHRLAGDPAERLAPLGILDHNEAPGL